MSRHTWRWIIVTAYLCALVQVVPALFTTDKGERIRDAEFWFNASVLFFFLMWVLRDRTAQPSEADSKRSRMSRRAWREIVVTAYFCVFAYVLPGIGRPKRADYTGIWFVGSCLFLILMWILRDRTGQPAKAGSKDFREMFP